MRMRIIVLIIGLALTIKFKIDFGPEIAKFITLEKLWDGTFFYGDPDNDIEIPLSPVEITRASGAAFVRLRIQHTGHGMDRPSGCSEF